MAISAIFSPSPYFGTLILLLAAASSLIPAASSSSPVLGLDSFMSDRFRSDPQATNDTFVFLPSSIKNSISLASAPLDTPFLLKFLFDLKLSVSIHVKLVGSSFSLLAPEILRDFVLAAVSGGKFQTIGFQPHNLAVSHELRLDASIAAPHLATDISAAVRSHMDASTAPLLRSSLQSVPYSIVDAIVHQDFNKDSNSAPAFYIYLLDLGIQSRPYAYSFDPKDPSPGFSKCLGSVWTGKDRYVWIDLGAGPVDYGPALSGEGVLPRGEFHPLAALHGRPKSEKTLLADLASLIFSAYKTLLVPSLRIPIFFESDLSVRFIHVQSSDAPDPSGLNWAAIEATINEGGMLLPGQTLKFETHKIKLSDCPICSFAIARSTNFYTSRFFFQNFTLIVSEYLDSKRLHQVLVDSSEEIQSSMKISNENLGRVLPVYVFDLDFDKLLLLDRYHQAVAFRDMIIAVRTRSSQTVSDYTCNGRHMITQARNLERPIVGSVLQSLWGVSPTHLSWSPQHNHTIIDYTWSIGQTPFGPFSDSLSLSFVQKDAARRNVLLTSLNYTILSATDVVQSLALYGGERKLLQGKRRTEFVQRWNLLKYKLEKTVSAMSHLDYVRGFYYLRSSDHDLYALHSLVYQASQEMEASLVCFKDPPFPWGTVSVSGVIVFAFCFAYLNRDRLFRSKRKQF